MSGVTVEARGSTWHPFGALVWKELRDLRPLACGVFAAATLAAAWIARRLALAWSLDSSTWTTVLAAAACVCALPLAAEAFSADHRSGAARAAQGWPVRGASSASAKVVALAACTAVIAAGIALALGLVPHVPHPPWSVTSESMALWSPIALRAAATALVGVVLAAAVTRHGLASMLVGVGVLVAHVAPFRLTANAGTLPSATAMRALMLYVDEDVLGAVGWTAMLAACAAPALALRGRLARHMGWRAASTAVAVACALGLWWRSPLPGDLRAATLPLDDPRAWVAETVIAPEGVRIAFALRHEVAPHLPPGQTWWCVDLDTGTTARRLSTEAVARATAIGMGLMPELVAWTPDESALVGVSHVRMRADDQFGTCWTLRLADDSVRTLAPAEYSRVIGDTLRRGTPAGSTAGTERALWYLTDGPETLETALPAKRYGSCVEARGIGHFLDDEGRLHRLDLVAGVVRPLSIVIPPRSDVSFQISQDGRHAFSRDPGAQPRHGTLYDLVSGDTVAFEARYYPSFGRGATALVVPLGPDNESSIRMNPRPAMSRWRIVTMTGTRDIDLGVAAEEVHSLADGRFVARSAERRVLTLHAGDGRLLATLRAPAAEVTP